MCPAELEIWKIVTGLGIQKWWGLDVFIYTSLLRIQSAFSALTLLVGRQEGHPACKKTEWWGTGMVICLEQGANLYMVRLMPLPPHHLLLL